MSKPDSSLEVSKSVILGISLGERRQGRSDTYRRVCADRSGTVESPRVRKVLGVELPESSVLRPPAR